MHKKCNQHYFHCAWQQVHTSVYKVSGKRNYYYFTDVTTETEKVVRQKATG
jgi:hypothetical protein